MLITFHQSNTLRFYQRLKMIIGLICLILPIIACDMPVNYGVVQTPFEFETVSAEDQYWTVEVKPHVMYEVSVITVEEKTGGGGSLSISTQQILDCETCKNFDSGSLSNDLKITVIPLHDKITIHLLSGSNKTRCILDVREVEDKS